MFQQIINKILPLLKDIKKFIYYNFFLDFYFLNSVVYLIIINF